MIENENSYIFDGPFAIYCSMYVDYKIGLGYKFQVSSYYRLRQIDNYFKGYSLKKPILTRSMVEEYVGRRGSESTKTQHQRMSTIRQFALFMNSLGFNFYVFPLNEFVKIKDNFLPYIFTHEEIADIWSIVDTMSVSVNRPHEHYIYPMLLRMLYGCGLRINEALSLQKTDINLDEGVLTINQAKNNITRYVPMSKTLTIYCRHYVQQMTFNLNTEGLFYPKPNGEKYHSQTILSTFRNVLSQADIITTQAAKPRIHDLRHTFAVHSLEKMVSSGFDSYATLPILQIYMGHRDIKSTEQYLRMTSDTYQHIIESTLEMYRDVLPVVTDYE